MKRHAPKMVLALALIAAACGSSSEGEMNSPTTAVSTTDGPTSTLPESTTAETADSPADGPTTLELKETDLGTILVDSSGATLYLFLPDEQGPSTCYNDCEAAWPVLGEVENVGDGLEPALLGTTERNSGELQATYNGWPLYHFSADTTPGDAKGQGANGVWYVVGAAGQPIGAP